jgi:hypothetical protein
MIGAEHSTRTPRQRNARRPNRKPASLLADLELRLTAYAGAAVAAGVSMAAMATPAEAKVVYTSANVDISRSYYRLDLNNDGIPDFLVSLGGDSIWSNARVACSPKNSNLLPPKGMTCNYYTNEIWGRGVASGRFVSALSAGVKVGPSKEYFQAAQYPFFARMGSIEAKVTSTGAFSATFGQWLETENRYLGLQFVVNGELHYGWARLNLGFVKGKLTARLTGYAYETIPDQPIITGNTGEAGPAALEPTTLGHLAAGASQIEAWRGEKKE